MMMTKGEWKGVCVCVWCVHYIVDAVFLKVMDTLVARLRKARDLGLQRWRRWKRWREVKVAEEKTEEEEEEICEASCEERREVLLALLPTITY